MKQLTAAHVALAALVSITPGLAAEEMVGTLEAYVARPDDSFEWVKRREGRLAGGTYAELRLTSQTWRGLAWKHQLFVFKPAEVADGAQTLLLIAGGRWHAQLEGPAGAADGLPREAHLVAAAASLLKSPVAVLLQVPHQPLFGGLVEDELIAYTFDQYLKTEDADWPLLLPMVKSAVRAMDAVQEFTADEWSLEIGGFTLTGASKRGWTTWLTAAVDPRVTALAPMVIDMLNMESQVKHQLATWGRLSEQVHEYVERRLPERTATPAGRRLHDLVDPYRYRQLLQQPKLILLGTNDRYWPLDAANLYWDGLGGEKYLLYVPNNGHGLSDLTRILGGVRALHRRARGELQLPKLSWSLEQQGGNLVLSLDSDQPPKKVSAWMATSPTKDFRDATWRSEPVEAGSQGYRYVLQLPAQGYAALFGEATYEDEGVAYFLSTNVKIAAAPKQ